MLRRLRKRWPLKSCLPPDIYVICINALPSLCYSVFGSWSRVGRERRQSRRCPDVPSTWFEKKNRQGIVTEDSKQTQDVAFRTPISLLVFSAREERVNYHPSGSERRLSALASVRVPSCRRDFCFVTFEHSSVPSTKRPAARRLTSERC